MFQEWSRELVAGPRETMAVSTEVMAGSRETVAALRSGETMAVPALRAAEAMTVQIILHSLRTSPMTAYYPTLWMTPSILTVTVTIFLGACNTGHFPIPERTDTE